MPRVRRDYTTDMLTAIPALAMLTGYRAMLPRRARAALREGRFDAIMAHWRVVTRALVRAVAEGGGELYVWTVDDARMIQRLTRDGRRRDHHQRPAAVRVQLSYPRPEACSSGVRMLSITLSSAGGASSAVARRLVGTPANDRSGRSSSSSWRALLAFM